MPTTQRAPDPLATLRDLTSRIEDVQAEIKRTRKALQDAIAAHKLAGSAATGAIAEAARYSRRTVERAAKAAAESSRKLPAVSDDLTSQAAIRDIERKAGPHYAAQDRLEELREEVHAELLRLMEAQEVPPGELAEAAPYDQIYIDALRRDAGLPPWRVTSEHLVQLLRKDYADADAGVLLPGPAELAETYGASRRVVDQALERLHEEGVLDRTGGVWRAATEQPAASPDPSGE
ncbi:GntR family transcriptional regulator [Streptomyces harbinensis]|uniref:GntR family transcriptional regulator n=1 Tax=Streptomyces harbinensis TaxID=1176198 RepID=UPI00371F5C88